MTYHEPLKVRTFNVWLEPLSLGRNWRARNLSIGTFGVLLYDNNNNGKMPFVQVGLIIGRPVNTYLQWHHRIEQKKEEEEKMRYSRPLRRMCVLFDHLYTYPKFQFADNNRSTNTTIYHYQLTISLLLISLWLWCAGLLNSSGAVASSVVHLFVLMLQNGIVEFVN